MNRKQLAFLPDDIPLRLGPPIRLKPKVEVTPAPPFMVEALERIEDMPVGGSFGEFVEQKIKKIAEGLGIPESQLFQNTNYASGAPHRYHSGGITTISEAREIARRAMSQADIMRAIAEHEASKPQPTHGSVTVVIDESTPVKFTLDHHEFIEQQIKKLDKAISKDRERRAEQAKEYERRRSVMNTLALKVRDELGVTCARGLIEEICNLRHAKLIDIPDDKIEDAIQRFKDELHAKR